MKLSIVILMCDKDYMYIEQLVKNIDSKVKPNHEIIIIDNRETTKDFFINTGNAKVIDNGKNLYQLESRRRSIDYVAGDYVWFVDGDDDIFDVEDFCYTDDIICFNFVSDKDKYKNWYEEEELVTENLVSDKMFMKSGSQLWNKWFKKDVIKKVYSLIQTGLEVSSLEDFIVSAISLKYAESFRHINKTYYFYHTDKSNAIKDCFESVEQCIAFTRGHNMAHSILCDNFNDIEFSNMGFKNLYESTMNDFVRRLVLSDTSVMKECIKPLLEIYSGDMILIAVTRAYPETLSLDKMVSTLKELESILNIKHKELEAYKQKQRVSFILHTQCNEKCPYCNGEHFKEFISDDEIYDRFDKALLKMEEMTDKNIFPQLLGGEPSLWSDWLQNKIIERLKGYESFLLFTNGSNPDSILCKAGNTQILTHVIGWHASSRLPAPAPNEAYTIVVCHDDVPLLDEWLTVNDGMQINVAPCTGSTDELNCTSADLATITTILAKHNIKCCFTPSCECNRKSIVWQVDCNTMEVYPCCKSSERWPLAEFTGQTCTQCDGCMAAV